MTLPAISIRYESNHDTAVSGMRQVGNAAQDVQRRTSRATAGAGRMSAAFARMGKVSGATRGKIQQVSFQIQDIITQLQSGTRASVTFSQQLPQLAGAFGAVGAAIGVGVGLAIPALALAMSNLRGEAVDLGEALDELEDALAAVSRTAKAQNESLAALSGRYEGTTREVIELLEAQRRLAQRQLQNSLTAAFDALSESAPRSVRRAIDALDLLDKTVGVSAEQLSRSFNTLPAKTRQAAQAIVDFRAMSEAPLEEQVDAAQETAAALEALNDTSYDAAIEALLIFAERGRRALASLTDEANEFNSAIGRSSYGGGRGGDPRQFEDDRYWQDKFFPDPQNPNKSGSGRKTPLKVIEEELEPAEKRLKEHMDRLYALTKGGLSDQAGAWSDYFDALGSSAGRSGKELLDAAKAFGAGQALVDAWEAHNAVLKDPTLPWWMRIPAAGAVLGAGLGAVSAIKSVRPGGGRGSAGASGVAGAATPAGPHFAISMQQNIQGDYFTPDQIAQSNRSTLETLAEEVRRRGGSMDVLFP